MIEILDGLWLDPASVKVVKAIGDDKCVLFVAGQSALDGFVLDYSAEDVVGAIHDALYGEEESQENPK